MTNDASFLKDPRVQLGTMEHIIKSVPSKRKKERSRKVLK